MALFGETNAAVPTVTFAVVSGNRELANVQVYSDETLLATGLDGRAVALDPGRHRFRFVLPRGGVLNSEILLREGEKNRLVTVRLAESRPASGTSEPDVPAERPSSTRSLPATFWVASGVGLAALATGTTFALWGRAEEQRIADCAPSCPPELATSLDKSRRDYLIANISFGVAAASAGTALVLYLARPTDSGKPPPPVVSAISLKSVAILPSATGVSASAGFQFGAL
jgi:hypothetical protein